MNMDFPVKKELSRNPLKKLTIKHKKSLSPEINI